MPMKQYLLQEETNRLLLSILRELVQINMKATGRHPPVREGIHRYYQPAKARHSLKKKEELIGKEGEEAHDK